MLLPVPIMRRAFEEKDPSFDGIFFVGVTTTGVFCRPVCKARTPRPEHVTFFPSAADAVQAGFRACKRCRPLEGLARLPDILQRLLALLDQDPTRRLTEAEVSSLGFDPSTVRRQFKDYCGTTFQQYQRARRIGAAFATLQAGGRVIDAQIDGGYDSGSGFRAAFAKMFGEPPASLRYAGKRADEQSDAVPLVACRIDTPLGAMLGMASAQGICLFDFMDRKGLEQAIVRLRSTARAPVIPGTQEHLQRLKTEIGQYFAGERSRFSVALDLRVGTAFQRRAWEYLRSIPYGQTRSYAAQAQALQQPAAVRAVGSANGMNYLAILIPCHRVVGSTGALTGYGGGVARKRWLLDHEQRLVQGGAATP
jgi:AraC family transcriptional regulator, regulatory protein of adaptative response / methylated-DNA-[protein]-cysteine methyltransferase